MTGMAWKAEMKPLRQWWGVGRFYHQKVDRNFSTLFNIVLSMIWTFHRPITVAEDWHPSWRHRQGGSRAALPRLAFYQVAKRSQFVAEGIPWTAVLCLHQGWVNSHRFTLFGLTSGLTMLISLSFFEQQFFLFFSHWQKFLAKRMEQSQTVFIHHDLLSDLNYPHFHGNGIVTIVTMGLQCSY